MCLLSWAIFIYNTIEQFGRISLAIYKFVLISHIIMLASIYAVPIINSLLLSERAKQETSGEIAVNLYSSILKNVYFEDDSASF